MDDIEFITTADGSHTLRHKRLNETYHSVHGAIQESSHVFIANGLQYFHQERKVDQVSVLEVGFGTGLNTLLSLRYASANAISIRYHTLEPFPLTKEIWSQLNYAGDDRRDVFQSLHEAPWDRETPVTPEFTLLKQQVSLQDVHLKERYDVVYFDAFAPSVQPELWACDLLRKVTDRLNAGGVFTTYSARGQMKRDLRSLGMLVETLPGPPGKMEMVRAVRS